MRAAYDLDHTKSRLEVSGLSIGKEEATEGVNSRLIPARNGTVSFSSDDIDEAREIGTELYYPHEVRILGDEQRFNMRLKAAQTGPVTVGRLGYGTAVEIYTNELHDAYQVNIPLRGTLITRSGRAETVATPHHAAVYRCDQRSLLRGWSDEEPSPVVAVKINRQALEQQLAQQLRAPIHNPIVFEMDLDLDTTLGRQWLRLVEELSRQLDAPEALGWHPMMAAPMAECLMAGLLVTAEHDYRSRLMDPSRPALPSAVSAAIDYIEAMADEPLTSNAIARAAGVSTRSLQVGFRQSVGTTPMRYLRSVRLQRAHHDLLHADPTAEEVRAIAHRWGFTHLPRFAGEYRAMFGESPSQTLRSVPFHRA